MLKNKTRNILFAIVVGVLFTAAVLLIPGKSVPAQGPDNAHIVVQFGHDGSLVREIQFTAPISGLAALQQTGLDVVTKDYGGGFIAVCAIEDVGCPADDCFCDPSNSWGNYSWDGNAWQAYGVGAADTQLNDGAVDGWVWGVWGETPADADPALAAQSALDWMRLQQVITDGGFGADSITMDALIAVGVNHEAPRNWSAAPGAPSLMSYFLVNGHRIAAKDAGDAGKLATGLAATDLCYPYGGVTPMDYYDDATGLYDPLPPNHAMGIMGTAALSHTVPITAVQALKNMQNSDGGWGWAVGQTSDSNSTALSIQALVAAGEPVTATEVVSGLIYLKSAQNTNGGFTYDPFSPWGTASDTNSTAYAINAIYAVGQDPITGTWVISSTNPMEFLLSMQLPNGAFEWQSGYGANLLATAQAIPALLGQHLPPTKAIVPMCPPQNFLPLIIRE